MREGRRRHAGASPADLSSRFEGLGDDGGGGQDKADDNSVAIVLSYGTARVLLAGDAKANLHAC
jgi:beta-lactamase superfamily II metal-dependent hydrolase